MITELTNQNYDNIISGSDIPLVIEFYSPTCVHCKRTEVGINELDAEGINALFARCDITQQTNIAEMYGVTALPTLIFIKDGDTKNKLTGFTHKLIIAEEIKKLV